MLTKMQNNRILFRSNSPSWKTNSSPDPFIQLQTNKPGANIIQSAPNDTFSSKEQSARPGKSSSSLFKWLVGAVIVIAGLFIWYKCSRK